MMSLLNRTLFLYQYHLFHLYHLIILIFFFNFRYRRSFIICKYLSIRWNFLVILIFRNSLKIILIFFFVYRCTNWLWLHFIFRIFLEFGLNLCFLFWLAFRSTVSTIIWYNPVIYFFFTLCSCWMTLLRITITNKIKLFLFIYSRKYLINSKFEHIFDHSRNILF